MCVFLLMIVKFECTTCTANLIYGQIIEHCIKELNLPNYDRRCKLRNRSIVHGIFHIGRTIYCTFVCEYIHTLIPYLIEFSFCLQAYTKPSILINAMQTAVNPLRKHYWTTRDVARGLHVSTFCHQIYQKHHQNLSNWQNLVWAFKNQWHFHIEMHIRILSLNDVLFKNQCGVYVLQMRETRWCIWRLKVYCTRWWFWPLNMEALISLGPFSLLISFVFPMDP